MSTRPSLSTCPLKGFHVKQWRSLCIHEFVSDWVWGHFSDSERAILFFHILTQHGQMIKRVAMFSEDGYYESQAVVASYQQTLFQSPVIEDLYNFCDVSFFNQRIKVGFEISPQRLMRKRQDETIGRRLASYYRWSTTAQLEGTCGQQTLHGITEYIRFRPVSYGAFFQQHIINIIFGITTFITSAIALSYQQLEHKQKVEHTIDEGRKVGLFLNREAMIEYLLEMYDQAEADDIIWAQCVHCVDFSLRVREQIFKAASRGVRFQMMVNGYSPSAIDFQAMFEPFENAQSVFSYDNTISMQGLSTKEVVLSFPSINAYRAVVIRASHFTQIMFDWFMKRFELTHPSTEV